MSIFLITGISGSGKSVALNALEDAGYDCVDNLPINLLENLIADLSQSGIEKLAIAIDARRGKSIIELPEILSKLAKSYNVQLIFLNSSTESLVKRFSETRRRHPLSNAKNENPQNSLIEAIQLERDLMKGLNELGHQIDTSNISANTLRAWVLDLIQHQHSGLTLLFESFGFKHGLPQDADLVFDVRCLTNPFYDLSLRPLTGNDEAVVEFLLKNSDFLDLAKDIESFIKKWLPKYMLDQRSYLTIAIGCTGGQHRSIAMANYLFNQFVEQSKSPDNRLSLLLRHREITIASN
ncbi:MAG: RNase adapter RapZ [Betaproteobacteria bacterium]|jgi:UPF0042 nucleotide-binding protein